MLQNINCLLKILINLRIKLYFLNKTSDLKLIKKRRFFSLKKIVKLNIRNVFQFWLLLGRKLNFSIVFNHF